MITENSNSPFDKKNLSSIGTYLHFQRISPTHYMITPESRFSREYQEAMTAALNFTTKEQYLVWVEQWVVLYQKMIVDARGEEFHWNRAQRHAMMHLRAEGKKKSWAMKQERLQRGSTGKTEVAPVVENVSNAPKQSLINTLLMRFIPS